MDSKFQYAGAVNLVVAFYAAECDGSDFCNLEISLFDGPGCLGRVGSRPSDPAIVGREAQGKISLG